MKNKPHNKPLEIRSIHEFRCLLSAAQDLTLGEYSEKMRVAQQLKDYAATSPQALKELSA